VINYRNRPKGQYIQEASWQDLYKLTEEWKNNLEFQLFEIEFLQNLIKRYFVELLDQENLDELRELQKDLYQYENQSKLLLENIDVHLNHIVKVIDEPFTFDASVFRREHELLEDDTSVFLIKHNTMKLTAFKMVKDSLQNEDPKFVWKYN
jgi:hypothetical protein